jgi:hypothetical protein
LSVQTAQIEGQFNRNIPEGSTIAALVKSQATGYGGGSVAARTPQGTAPAEPAQPAASAPVSTQSPVVTYNTGEAGPAGGTIFYPAVRTASVPPATTRDYKVGDTGPAGGLIFYVNPDAGEWKYLEAAPANTEKTSFWASEKFSYETIKAARAVGEGKPNTEFIMRVANERGGGFDWAAEICDSLVVNGYDDWFLPSRDELHMMYGNLQRRGLGGFKSESYWSSTIQTDLWFLEVNWNSDGACTENFSNGEQGHGASFTTACTKRRVRAIRQF